MPTPHVTVINRSSIVGDAEGRTLVAALQVQVARDFAPLWGSGAVLSYTPTGQHPVPGAWWLVLLDDSDQADALGYHDVSAEGYPIGKVFAKTTRDDGGDWHVTASHELLEMLGDPETNLCAAATDAAGRTRVYALESCDAVEDDALAYPIQVGSAKVLVSDFVTREWFNPAPPPGARFDYLGHCTAPLQLLKGGYIGVIDAAGGWTQETADGAPHPAGSARYRGNRWHRRAAGARRRSTAHAEAL